MKLRVTVEGKTYEVEVEVLEEGLSHGSSVLSVEPAIQSPPQTIPSRDMPSADPPASVTQTSDRVIKAPIMGTILELKVSPGDVVMLNQVLLVMEAMKMETNVASPLEGKVKSILVATGEAVKTGQVLIELE